MIGRPTRGLYRPWARINWLGKVKPGAVGQYTNPTPPPPSFIPALQFNDARNSMYLPTRLP